MKFNFHILTYGILILALLFFYTKYVRLQAAVNGVMSMVETVEPEPEPSAQSCAAKK